MRSFIYPSEASKCVYNELGKEPGGMRVGGGSAHLHIAGLSPFCVSALAWLLFSVTFYETEAHLEALGCFSLFNEAQPGFRRGGLCLEAVFPPSTVLALSHEVPTVGLALDFPTLHRCHHSPCE